jgi:hypothetical protein
MLEHPADPLNAPAVHEYIEFDAAIRELPDELVARLSHRGASELSVEEQAHNYEQASARSARLHDAHLESVKDRAHRETQRGEEASARRRRLDQVYVESSREKVAASLQKSEAVLAQQDQKREADKARRAALAEAAMAKRETAEVDVLQKGLFEADREKKAMARRDSQLEEVVKRNSMEVSHAMQVATEQKTLRTEREAASGSLTADGNSSSSSSEVAADGHLPSPHPLMVDRQAAPSTPNASASAEQTTPTSMKRTPSKSDEEVEQLAPSDPIERGEALPTKNVLPSMPTPRMTESPRRPEMPTILEDVSNAGCPSPLPHPPPTLPCHAPRLAPHRFLPPLSRFLCSASAGAAQEYEDDWRAAWKVERCFERHYFRMPTNNGSSFIYCYEIRWADGTRRVVQGVPMHPKLLALSDNDRVLKRL